jgi:hypothetical protein
MKIRMLGFGLLCAAGLCAQHRFSWQEACFKNPGAPYCPGHDFAVKPSKNAPPRSFVPDPGPFPATPQSVTPSVIVVGGIDWRFADPLADAVVGFDSNRLSASPLALNLIAQLGTSQGLTDQDMQKIFEGLSGADQVALSVRDNRIVVMVTGRMTDSTLPALEPGWKAVPVLGNATLIGHADAVDQAVQRIAMDGPPAELTRLAKDRQANSDFWAAGSTTFAGPQAVSAGAKRFSLTVSMLDHVTSDTAFEFNAVPDAEMWPATLGGATIEGNVVQVRMSLEAYEVRQRFGRIAADSLGQRLGELLKTARYLPLRAAQRTKPTIYGLDDGPKEVKQYPNRRNSCP